MLERDVMLARDTPGARCADLAARIVAAHAGHSLGPDDADPALLHRVFQALAVIANVLICPEDGEPSRMLKRHLRTAHGITPAQYRLRWDLPDDDPMVSPQRSRQRSACARATGLGSNRRGLIANRLTKTNETLPPRLAETLHPGVVD